MSARMVTVECFDDLQIGDMVDEGTTVEAMTWPDRIAEVAVVHGQCEDVGGWCCVTPVHERCELRRFTFPCTVLRGVPVPIRGCTDLTGCARVFEASLAGGDTQP